MYNKILVPVDILEKELTNKIIPHIEFLGHASNAEIHFFHVLPVAAAIINAYSFGYEEFQDQAEKKTEQWLQELISSVNLPKDRLSYSIAFGNPRDEITKEANAIKADLIVIGSRRPDITTHLLGSNAAGVVRYAKISVLVVR